MCVPQLLGAGFVFESLRYVHMRSFRVAGAPTSCAHRQLRDGLTSFAAFCSSSCRSVCLRVGEYGGVTLPPRFLFGPPHIFFKTTKDPSAGAYASVPAADAAKGLPLAAGHGADRHIKGQLYE